MKLSFLFSLILLFSFQINASHIAGGEITYRYIGDSTGIQRHYLVRLTMYQDRSGISIGNTQNINYTSSCNSGGFILAPKINSTTNGGVPLQSAYDCADLSQPGSISFAKWVFEMDVVLPAPCSDWNFYWSSCCRNPSITNINNPASQGFILKSQLNNYLGPNSSPVFTTEAARQFCAHSPEPLVLSQHCIEPDGDSLLYYLAQPLDDPYPGTPIPWEPGFGINNPITTANGINLNAATGVMIFKPTAVEVDVFKINVDEFRFDSTTFHWNKISTITRELQIPIVNTCNIAAVNWNIQIPDSTANEIVASCGTQEIEFKTSVPVACSSISPDGTDFIIYKSDGTLLPVVSANGVCVNGYTTLIKIQLSDTISQNDSMQIVSYVGSDLNTLINYCGFSLPIGDSIALVVNSCPNIGLIENKIVKGIYPNPFEEFIELEFGNNSLKTITIYNSNGQLVLSSKIEEKAFTLDLRNLPEGIYIVQVAEDANIVSKKIVKK